MIFRTNARIRQTRTFLSNAEALEREGAAIKVNSPNATQERRSAIQNTIVERCFMDRKGDTNHVHEFTDKQPVFAITAKPVEPGEVRPTTNVICELLLRLDLDTMRTALSKKGYARGISRRRGPVQMDVTLMTKPLDFGIIVGFHGGANVVRLSPKCFDRTVPQQETIYQKCIGMLEVFSTAPVGKHARPIAIDALHFKCNETEKERKAWEKILRRWQHPA